MMKLTLEPTEQFFLAGEAMVRMWQGHDDQGAPVVALVAGVYFTGDATAVAEGLVSIPPPDAEAQRRWAATVLTGPS